MFKQRPDANREGEADIPSALVTDCPPVSMPPDAIVVETDLSSDRQVTDAELEAIVRLLGDDLARLLDQSQSH